jgi:hypothetical protein
MEEQYINTLRFLFNAIEFALNNTCQNVKSLNKKLK